MSRPQTAIIDFDSDQFLSVEVISKLENLQKLYPEPDYFIMDSHLESIEYIAVALGQVEVSFDRIRQRLEDICAKAVSTLEFIERYIENIESLPDHIEWKSKAYDKLTHLANRIEDVAETCALASSTEFAQMIQAEVQNLVNAEQKN